MGMIQLLYKRPDVNVNSGWKKVDEAGVKWSRWMEVSPMEIQRRLDV